MKFKPTVILILIAAVVVTSCRPLPSACFPKMTPVHVYSGTISQDTIFTPNAAYLFDIKDNAMGLIDSTAACDFNALYDFDNHVYIFSDGSYPSPDFSLFQSLRLAKWVLKDTYALKRDAQTRIFANEFTMHIREAGQYPIYEATINGEKVYKYLDRYYIEDYKNFLRHHEYQRPPFAGVKPVELIRDIAGQGYIRRVGTSGLPVFTANGRVDYTTGLITAPDSTDKIYFEKPGQAINFRLRHVYHSPEERSQIESFYTNGRVKDEYLRIMVDEQGYLIGEMPVRKGEPKDKRYMGEKPNADNPLFQKLNEINGKHLEKVILGYVQCPRSSEGGYKSIEMQSLFRINDDRGLDSPPLPLTGNGN